MIKRYNDFIFENSLNGITDIEYSLLMKYDIKNYKFNSISNSIDIYGDLQLQAVGLSKLPDIRFGQVYGDFLCQDNNLSSFENCPKIVNGNFYCSNNIIRSIEDYPLCIIKEKITNYRVKGKDNKEIMFWRILQIIKPNEEIFIPLLDNKIKFHQMIMRIDPSLIDYYNNIPPPKNNSTLFI